MTKTQGLWVGLCVYKYLSYVLCMMSYNNIINLLLYTCMYMYMSCINTQDSGTHIINIYCTVPGPNLPGMIRLGNSRVIHPNLPKYLHGTKNVSHECSYNIAL